MTMCVKEGKRCFDSVCEKGREIDSLTVCQREGVRCFDTCERERDSLIVWEKEFDSVC